MPGISGASAGLGASRDELHDLSAVLPFWPIEPFMSLIVMGLGTLLMATRVPAPYRAGDVSDRRAGA